MSKVVFGLGGRKFIMAMFIVIASFVYRAFGWIDQTCMQVMVLGISTLFIGGNVLAKSKEPAV